MQALQCMPREICVHLQVYRALAATPLEHHRPLGGDLCFTAPDAHFYDTQQEIRHTTAALKEGVQLFVPSARSPVSAPQQPVVADVMQGPIDSSYLMKMHSLRRIIAAPVAAQMVSEKDRTVVLSLSFILPQRLSLEPVISV